MIGIVDYGVGNVQALMNVYERLGLSVRRCTAAEDLHGMSRLILPGVGSFDWAVSRLDASGLRSRLEEMVISDRVPILGICVGMQMMADDSDEGRLPGLGWIPGRVVSLSSGERSERLPVPHMGWNDVVPTHTLSGGFCSLFAGLNEWRFYFLHSYRYAVCNEAHEIARCQYGSSFSCAIRRDNVWGVQFHPEKSHSWGAEMLKNFAGEL